MDVHLSPIKQYKLFLVEVDDDDRERVLEARVSNISIRNDTEYQDMFSDYSMAPVGRYTAYNKYVIEEMTLEPLDDKGTYIRVRDFSKEETEE